MRYQTGYFWNGLTMDQKYHDSRIYGTVVLTEIPKQLEVIYHVEIIVS